MPGFDSHLLQQHDQFLRRLARTLVRDENTADDITQETWLAAVGADLGRVANVRGWLRTTMQNCLAMRRRLSLRAERRHQEHRATTATTAPATDEVVHRLHEHRELLDAIERLAEPYRTTILLRFLDALPPRSIAARQGVPVETVRTRLQRGLQRLRQDLDQRHGSRAAWCTPLAAWCRSPSPSLTPLAAMALPSQVKAILAVCAVTTCALGAWWWTQRMPLALPPASPGASVADAALAKAPIDSVAGAAPVREAVPDTAAAAAGAGATSAVGRIDVVGRVFTVEAVPLPGAAVEQRGDPSRRRTSTDADGRFVLSAALAGDAVIVADPAWRTVLSGTVNTAAQQERVLVVGPAMPASGRVVDASGLPIARARLWLTLPDDFRSRFPVVLDYSTDETFSTWAGDDGSFAMPDCARVRGSVLQVQHDAFVSRALPLDEVSEAMLIVLQRRQPEPGLVRGQVVDERDLPVPGAYVAAGNDATITDERGEFLLERSKVNGLGRLAASKRGMMPAFVVLDGAPEYVKLRLRSASASIDGTVVAADGTPLAGAKVWVADATFLGAAGGLDSSCEGIAGGGLGLAEHRADEERLASLSPLAAAARRQPSGLWCFVRTDAGGAFTLRGLAERSYRLRVQAPSTLQTVELGPFPADSKGLRLVMPAGGVFQRVTGQVTDGDGRAIAGATLVVRVRTLALPVDRDTITYRNELRDEVACDSEGRFTLTAVPKDAVLVVHADGVEPTGFGGEGEIPFATFATGPASDDLVDLALVCVARCQTRIELADPDRADQVVFLDHHGQRLPILRIEGHRVDRDTAAQLHAGKSVPLNVPANAATAVLSKAGVEVARIPITLRAGQQNLIR